MTHTISSFIYRVSFALLLLCCASSILLASNYSDPNRLDFIEMSNKSINTSHINTIIDKMTIREKIAQIMILSFNCDFNNRSTKEAIELIKKEKIGGVIIMNSRLEQGVDMINYMQSLSKDIPLLVTIDGEWGASMRFQNVLSFPRQMQLGALNSDTLVYQMGRAIGEQLRRVGMHVNYAPTIDINNNPNNPVINTRAFGEDKQIVTQYGLAYMKGMQDFSIATSAKHFPGHGDTDIDSHKALPLLTFDRHRLDSLELYPFRKLIQHGVDMVMVGHLQIPSLDSSGTPSSISKKIVTDLLKNELEYSGIVITDALNMKGVADHLPAEQIPLEAYKVGCDILLMPENVKKAIDLLEQAVLLGDISEHSLNMRVKKMLALKDKLGILYEVEKIDKTNLLNELNNNRFRSLIQDISDNSITVIQNKNNLLPISDLKYQQIGYISLDNQNGFNGSHLAKALSRYSKIDSLIIKGNITEDRLRSNLSRFKDKSLIIIAIHNTDIRPQRDFGLNNNHFALLSEFSKDKNVILCYFGNPLALNLIPNIDNFNSFIVAYSNTIENSNSVSSLIFGSILSSGKLPVAAGRFNLRDGINTSINQKRVGYRLPEYYGIESKRVEEAVDRFINKVGSKTTDIQISLMKNGDIIYSNQKSRAIELSMVKGYISTLPIISYIASHNYISLEDFVNKHLNINKESIYYNKLVSDVIMNRVFEPHESDLYPKYRESNYDIQKEIIEKISNTSLSRLITVNILEAIGMIGTYIDNNGKLFSTSEDISRFIYVVQSLGKYGNCQIMDDKTLSVFNKFSHYYTKDDNGTIIFNNSNYNSAIVIIVNGPKSKEVSIEAENLRKELSFIIDNIEY